MNLRPQMNHSERQKKENILLSRERRDIIQPADLWNQQVGFCEYYRIDSIVVGYPEATKALSSPVENPL